MFSNLAFLFRNNMEYNMNRRKKSLGGVENCQGSKIPTLTLKVLSSSKNKSSHLILKKISSMIGGMIYKSLDTRYTE